MPPLPGRRHLPGRARTARLALVLTLSACGGAARPLPEGDPLRGAWRRVGDAYAGTLIEVGDRDGVLAYVPGLAQLAGYGPGEVKWARPRRLSEGRYALRDLNVWANEYGDRLEAEYRDVRLELARPDLAVITTGDGRRQLWARAR